MDTDKVFAVFAKLTGLSENEGREHGYLCDMSIDEITARLPEGDISCGGRAEYAAAALAYYRYVLWSMTDAAANIKVGEITVGAGKDRLKYAERICREALSRLGGDMDDGFVFRTVS